MGVHEIDAQAHQRRHAHGIARVIRERQERAAVGNESAVRRDAIEYRRHTEFADSEVHIVAAGRLRA